MNTDDMTNMLKDALTNPEAMAHPVIGPVMRQLARLLNTKLRSMQIEAQTALMLGGGDGLLTPDEARSLCEEGRSLCIEAAGAYGALTKLLPELMRLSREERGRL